MLQNIIQKREIKVFNVYIPYLESYNNKYISFEQADLKRTKLQQKTTFLKKNQQISIYKLHSTMTLSFLKALSFWQ